jgi:N6-adenosine-specific RNA methylase IME4
MTALVASTLAEHVAAIRALGKQTITNVIEIGRRLTIIRHGVDGEEPLLAHGEWLPWLEREFGWQEATARNFMRVYDMCKSAKFADLDLPMSSFYLLAAPSTPDGARREIAQRAEAGEELPVAEVKRIIDNAKLQEAKLVRADRFAERRAKWEANTLKLSNQNSPLPSDRRYPVILADPPWKFELFDGTASNFSGAAGCHYPTMPTEEICRLPVGDLATPDAVLFLWSTQVHLPDAWRVLEAWGFEYVTHMIWVKDKPGLGHWVRNQHEVLIIARRGDMRTPLPANRPPSVIEAPRREHSRKPDQIYELIERMFPGLPKIELFARTRREGWEAWGAEVGKFDAA